MYTSQALQRFINLDGYLISILGLLPSNRRSCTYNDSDIDLTMAGLRLEKSVNRAGELVEVSEYS